MRGEMILDFLKSYPNESYTADELAELMEIPRGSASGALSTFCELGLASHDGKRPRRYRVGPLATPTPNGKPPPARTTHSSEWVAGFKAGWREALNG